MPRLVPQTPAPRPPDALGERPGAACHVWSGLLIYWADDEYALRANGVVLVKFFPAGFYRAIDPEHGLATDMAWHFAVAWLFALSAPGRY